MGNLEAPERDSFRFFIDGELRLLETLTREQAIKALRFTMRENFTLHGYAADRRRLTRERHS